MAFRHLLVRRAGVFAIASVIAACLAWFTMSAWRDADETSPLATVARGELTVQLTESGQLRAANSITYRSTLEGREVEITFLVPDGIQVNAGDLLIKFDPTASQREFERTGESVKQAALDLEIADAELEDAKAAASLLDENVVSAEVEEADAQWQLATRRLQRAQKTAADHKSLLSAGFITASEFEAAMLDADEAEAAVRVSRRRLDQVKGNANRARTQARLRVAQLAARRTAAVDRLESLKRQANTYSEAIQASSVYARTAGLVVHEENLSANPPRRVQVGDRVTSSQPILTIPQVEHMFVHSTARESDVHLLRIGQPVTVAPQAFPEMRLPGQLVAVGALARTPNGQPYEERRFDLTVRVDGRQSELRPEMSARLEIQIARRQNALLIPVNAVFKRDGGTVAHVVRDGRVDTRQVSVGLSNERYFEVMGGVAENERVLLVDVRSGAPAPITRPVVDDHTQKPSVVR